MELKNIILIVIAILAIVLICAGAFFLNNDNGTIIDTLNATNNTNNTTDFVQVNDTVDVNNTTVVGDNSFNNQTAGNNTTDHKVYNPQTDSYVSVIGEKFDDEVNRWYTYDADGVRYYNTRIN